MFNWIPIHGNSAGGVFVLQHLQRGRRLRPCCGVAAVPASGNAAPTVAVPAALLSCRGTQGSPLSFVTALQRHQIN